MLTLPADSQYKGLPSETATMVPVLESEATRPGMVTVLRQVAVFQNFTDPSSAAVISNLPSAENATDHPDSLAAARVASSLRPATSQIFAV